VRFRVSAAIIVLATLCPATGGAQQYSFQYYGVDQGLADLAVRTLYQDARGFLWLSTENGVFRYDGERFRAFGQDEGLPVSNAAVFGEAPDGSLLVGGKFGLYRRVPAENRFSKVQMPGASQVMWGSGIQLDGHGVTYIATDAGLMVMNGSQLRLLDPPPHSGSPSAYGLLAENGSVWWGCGSEICLLADGTTTVFGPSSGLPAGSWRGIIREGNGDMWVQSVEGRVAVFRKEAARFQPSDLPTSLFLWVTAWRSGKTAAGKWSVARLACVDLSTQPCRIAKERCGSGWGDTALRNGWVTGSGNTSIPTVVSEATWLMA
jgi:ligand-binding sensor domain-containing protein